MAQGDIQREWLRAADDVAAVRSRACVTTRALTTVTRRRYVPESGVLTLLYHTDPGCSRPAVRRRLANSTAIGPLLARLDDSEAL